MSLLEVQQLRVEFGPVAVVTEVSFSVARGETVALVGESGSGKTVTSLAIMGLLEEPGRVDAGSIWFDGQNLEQLDERQRRTLRGDRMAMVFQDPMTSLNPVMRVGDQVAEGLRIHRDWTGQKVRRRVVELLGEVGLAQPEDLLGAYPHQLSGGMRQRVVIAMALACEPDLLIADEPTTALDVTVQARILELFAGLQSSRKMGLLMVTHDMGVVANVADRVVVMYGGCVVETGPTNELFGQPRHPYTQGLLASVPKLEGDGDRLTPIEGSPPTPDQRGPGCPFEPRCGLAREECLGGLPPLVRTGAGSTRCLFPEEVGLEASAPG